MGPVIDGVEVTEDDVGKKVTFVYFHGERQHGIISSIAGPRIWVKFKGPNGENCDSSHLVWGWQ